MFPCDLRAEIDFLVPFDRFPVTILQNGSFRIFEILAPLQGALPSQDTLKYIFAIFIQKTKHFWFDRLDIEYMVYTDNFLMSDLKI